jgi:diguanylate cyclase (GGDEF)-like protein
MDPKTIWSSSKLPSLPEAAVRLLEISKQDDFEVDDVIAAIKTDPAVTARILKSANSSFFGFRLEIRSIDRAVPLLGTNMVTSLALGFSLLDESTAPSALSSYFKTYWQQSVVQATAAELLSQCAEIGCHNESFQTGLLLDIGHLAMMAALGQEYLPVLEMIEVSRITLADAEHEVLDFDHTLIGSKLADQWKLPPGLGAAIARHHASIEVLSQMKEDPYFDLTKIAAFSGAAGDYFCRDNKGAALANMQLLGSEFFHFSEASVEQFLEELRPRIDESAQLFHMDTKNLGAASELMAEANSQLSSLAMRANMENALAVKRQHEMELEKENLKKKNEKLQHKALRDPLTGVYNRHFFDEALLSEMRRSKRCPTPIGIVFLDIDDFKQFNDTHGHLFGDHVIQHVAEILQESIRSADTIARYGGEEFMVLIHEPSMETLETTAERVRQLIESTTVEHDGVAASVTASFGASMMIANGEDSELAKALFASADEAMYDSKRAGRNCVHVRRLDCHRPSRSDSQTAGTGFGSPSVDSSAKVNGAIATLPAEANT